MKRFGIILSMFPILALLWACDDTSEATGEGSAAGSPGPTEASAPAGAADETAEGLSDFEMAARIRARLTADPVTAGERIHVAVADGRARLEGQATSGLAAVRAEAITALTVGADQVDNQLEGPPPTRSERREGARVPASVQAIRPAHTESVEGYGANAPAGEPEVVEAAPSPETAASASDDSAAGTAADDADSPTASDSPAASSTGPEGRRYTVQVGDSLWNIAADFMGSGARWEDLYEANRDVIGDDPMNLRAGIVITIPAD